MKKLNLADQLGIEAVSFVADKHLYLHQWRNDTRELFARNKAYLNTTFNSRPKYLGDTIPITGDSMLSWDEE